MALLNQSCIVHYNGGGKITRLIHRNEEVYITNWTTGTDKSQTKIFAQGVDEIKACSDGNGMLYVFCLNSMGDLDIFSVSEKEIDQSRIKFGCKDTLLRDFRPYLSGERCELLVSESKKENRNERILWKYTLDRKSLRGKNRDADYERKALMEYETFGPVDELAVVEADGGTTRIISVIEKSESANSIILLRDNRFGYVEGLIKISMQTEIFWHDMIERDQEVILAYTERDGERFSIKAVIYHTENHSLSKEILIREKAVCSHPVLVEYRGEIWICWYENGSVRSAVLENGKVRDCGMKWRDSMGKGLFCASFLIDDEDIKQEYGFHCRKVFLTYPDNHMTGFGRL